MSDKELKKDKALRYVLEWLIQKEPEGILTEMRKKSDAIRRTKAAEEAEKVWKKNIEK